jgi:steroid delta-isomerase-like uncharacterized protein
MSDEAKRAALEILRALGGDDDPAAVAARSVTGDFHNHSAKIGRPDGPEGYAATVGDLRTGFPDLRIEVEDVIAEGDRVVVRGWFTGTNDGPFMGRPATGRTVRMPQIHIFRMRDGRVCESWACMDELDGMRQLGVLPAPAAAA